MLGVSEDKVAADFSVRIYDIPGGEVKSFGIGSLKSKSGDLSHQEAEGLAGGIYFVILKSGAIKENKKSWMMRWGREFL